MLVLYRIVIHIVLLDPAVGITNHNHANGHL